MSADHRGRERALPPRPQASRRRYERLPIGKCSVRVFRTVLFGTREKCLPHPADGLDLSEVGIRLLVPARVAIGERLRLVATIETFHDTIEGEGSVVWFASNTGVPGRFLAGVEWTRLAPGHFAKIQQMRKMIYSREFQHRVRRRADLKQPE